jgi:hypothetical protein
MGRGDIAAAIHKRMCEDSRFGYSWEERWGNKSETWTVGGVKFAIKTGDYDCSSSTITAWRCALTGTKWAKKLDGATYTGNMRSVFTASGLFEWKPISFVASPGDLYLNEQNHVAMCQCQSPDTLSEFSSSETGGTTGKRGDQTGNESHLASYYDYPWDGILHYNGKADSATTSTSATKSTTGAKSKSEPKYRVMANWKWLDEMQGEKDTGGSSDTYAGDKGVAIQYFACDAPKYRVQTQNSGWLPWVTEYDTGDLDNGCAGDGSAILAIEVADSSIKFRVHVKGGKWLDWMKGQKDLGGSSDTFAGDGNPIDLVQMKRV